jgi:primosomal protein N''
MSPSELDFQIYRHQRYIRRLKHTITEKEALLNRLTGIRRMILYGHKKKDINFYKVKLAHCRDRLREYEIALNNHPYYKPAK